MNKQKFKLDFLKFSQDACSARILSQRKKFSSLMVRQNFTKVFLEVNIYGRLRKLSKLTMRDNASVFIVLIKESINN
ncbi:hypothetical protein BpHYR1_000322 [Brachionus plicatilis]|uniref:Uncharacterized protein n=1 Tax=Brachionus plicatilis TaxID=10195 RepID=A0A3M7R3R2_BRAPC|nr:hypothetical protein BpHYR1_000322 [Brachionus plicatilis]